MKMMHSKRRFVGNRNYRSGCDHTVLHIQFVYWCLGIKFCFYWSLFVNLFNIDILSNVRIFENYYLRDAVFKISGSVHMKQRC